MDEWLTKLCYIHTMEYYSAMKVGSRSPVRWNTGDIIEYCAKQLSFVWKANNMSKTVWPVEGMYRIWWTPKEEQPIWPWGTQGFLKEAMAKLRQECVAVGFISCVVPPATMERFRRTMPWGKKGRIGGTACEVGGNPGWKPGEESSSWRREWCHAAQRPHTIMGRWL